MERTVEPSSARRTLQELVEPLRREREQIVERLAELAAESVALRGDLADVDAVLKRLDPSSLPAPAKKRRDTNGKVQEGGGMSRLVPKPLTQDQLVEVLADMAQRVERGDSFEGSIEYLMPGPFEDLMEIPEDTYALVKASYRVGNTDGQGGVRLIGVWGE